ncbi:MAG: (Fe-S)-binding protein, partial [Acidimicrobiales bacterium]
MSIPILPSSAPFSDAQRAWLNGFFAGLLGVEAAPQNGALPNETNAGGASPEIGDLNAASISPAIAEQAQDEYPWHDPNLPLDERMQLAENKPFPLQLMAAMAQLDCGSCGYLCHSYAAAIASGEDKSLSKCSPGGSETMKKLKQLAASRPAENDASTLIVGSQSSQLSNEAATEEAPRRAAYDKAHPFPAGVLEVVPLTRKDSEKDVRHVALDLRGSGLEYEAGDALGVYPENCPELVELLLERLEATGEEPVLTPEGTVVPARLALSKAYVITHCADEWLQTLSHRAADPDESSRLASLAQNGENDYLEDCDTLDVLNDFPSARASTRAQIGEIISAMA